MKKASLFKTSQSGFSGQGAVILLILVTLVVYGGYRVIKYRDKDSKDEVSVTSINENEQTIPNGTLSNAANLIEEQLKAETSDEDNAIKVEAINAVIDTGLIDDLKGVTDENNL